MDERKLADALIRHDLGARSLDKGEADRITRLLNGMINDATRELASRHAIASVSGIDPGPKRTRFLSDTIEFYTAANEQIYSKIARGLETQLIDRAGAEQAFAARASKSAGASFGQDGFRPQSTDFLRSLVNHTPIPTDDRGGTALLKPWVQGMADGDLRRFESTLREGIGLGETTPQLVKRIEAGGWAQSRRSAQTVALTANAAIANAARLDTFKQMRSVKFVEYSAILDNRTSQICQSLSGKIFPIEGPITSPPQHPRCRSLLLPRKNDTDPPLHQPYREWLKGQSAKVQDEALGGKKRGDLYRAGKLPDDDLTKHDGSTKSAADLARHDDVVVPPEPAKPFSPINPDLTSGSIPTRPLRAVKAELQAQVAAAAQDSRYVPRAVVRGIKDTDLGKATVPSTLTDEAASLVLGLKGEVDAITDAFDVPRLRGIRTIPASTNHVMNMGDGTLGINAVFVNGYTGKVETKAAAELARVTKRVDELADLLKEGRAKYAETDGIGFFNEYAAEYREYRDLAEKQFKLKQSVNKTSRVAEKEVSEWKIGDDPAQRPWTADAYFDNPVDRMRSLLYHETAHHVHDYYLASGYVAKTAEGKVVRAVPRIVTELQRRFAKFKLSPLSKESSATKTAHFPSRYSTTNALEWWAENFSLYMMGRMDLVEPELKQLIEEMLDNAKRSN